ncbi:hypothetical protein J4G07_21945 [Candidatus Poribacteria bacterium]|nr:hypothetical protein [Candidatus Poribacteria bacterium]
MFWDVFFNRAILAGTVFFLLMIVGSQFYSWHVRRTTDAELQRTDHAVRALENRTQTGTTANTVETSRVDFEQAETPLENHDAQPRDVDTAALPSDDAETIDLSAAFLSDDFVSEEEPAEPVPVSPYGYGPYPEVPADYPETLMPVWTWFEDERQLHETSRLEDFELMGRVLIKLWNQGDRDFSGVIRDDENGKVYPLYSDRAYVTWRELKDENGKVLFRYAGNLRAGDGFPHLSFRDFMEGTIPPGIHFMEQESAGIDPYQFLHLQRR